MAPRYRQSRRSSYQNRTSRATNFPRRKISPLFYVLVCAIVLVCVLYGGYSFFPNVFNFDNDKYHKNETSSIDVNLVKSQELSIHFLELGNKVDGDCTLVKAGNTEVLIDAGSDERSITTIKNYIDQYIEDNVLEYVIVTHAHKDHYAGFATDEDEISLFDIYDIEIIAGEYRVIVNTLSSNGVSTTNDKGFVSDCQFVVSTYNINEDITKLLNDKNLLFVTGYNISYSYLNQEDLATISIPLSRQQLLDNISVYTYSNNKLVKVKNLNITTSGVNFTTNNMNSIYIIARDDYSHNTNAQMLILICIIGTFIALCLYAIVSSIKHRR